MKFKFAIDRGGTFTDVYAECPDGSSIIMKLLSEDPWHYENAPAEAIRRIISEYDRIEIFPGQVPIDRIDSIRMGTTVATNALLERKGTDCALLITKGFKDLLLIGTQSRPDLFDIMARRPQQLYKKVVEINERIILHANSDDEPSALPQGDLKSTRTSEKIRLVCPLNEIEIREQLRELLNEGITSIAVAFLHSYLWPEHEERVGQIALELGFKQVSLSSEIMPMIKIVPRGFTAVSDAYLTPCIKQYIDTFKSQFRGGSLDQCNVLFMKSDGGLAPMHSFIGSRAILSGPAGGVMAYSKQYQEVGQPLVGFDMGGTSTDVSRFAGEIEHVFEITMAGVQIQAPQLDINTVAAGGGSCLKFQSGIFHVGPESAGANPGPVCYGQGGANLTITDANLVLNRLLPEYFPKIFGSDQKQPLNAKLAMERMRLMTDQVNLWNQESGKVKSVEEVALGYVQVANETMCRPIRSLTQAKGYDTAKHVLMCFGGAGGQHASAIARALGMRRVVVHKYSSILSAYGIALADVVVEQQAPCQLVYKEANFQEIQLQIVDLQKAAKEKLDSADFDEIVLETFLNLRYDSTDCAIMCASLPEPEAADEFTRKWGDFSQVFQRIYQREMGFTLEGRKIIVDDVRIRASGLTPFLSKKKPPQVHERDSCCIDPVDTVKVFFEGGFQDTRVYRLLEEGKRSSQEISGPAIILDANTTVLVEPGDSAHFSESGDIIIDVKLVDNRDEANEARTQLDSIKLSIFSNRFMSIAEQMGHVLRRSAISTNIKERLDYSCAIFGPDGGLVANAPHIPVHLGAMQRTVQYQMTHRQFQPGDVILSNHPACGGTHLPDLTVITPVFVESDRKPVFFVANRGHHADIGGLTPGSMPPFSTSLQQEGASFKSFQLVRDGIFQEEAVIEALLAPGKVPGCSGSRNLGDNLSDLRAQISANACGIRLLTHLIDEYGLVVVQAYMGHIQTNAELAIRDFLRNFVNRRLAWQEINQVEYTPCQLKRLLEPELLRFQDYLDDGSVISLQVTIDRERGGALFDFTGSGSEVIGNTNAPEAIVHSSILYCLRLLVGGEIPLNQGCLKPIEIRIPARSILSPSEEAAVVCGNVITSQRIVDCVLGAFQACAASQGCMNSVTFGNARLGYYETVAGGAGAGHGWHGTAGIHTHMTNTRITDPEILEKRYPVILQLFSLRAGSGGQGKWTGGDGIRRKLLFRQQVTLCVLSQRRALAPYGMMGGLPGARGRNSIFRAANPTSSLSIGGFAQVQMNCGDSFLLETPGGGGYGLAVDASTDQIHSPTSLPSSLLKGSLQDHKINQFSA